MGAINSRAFDPYRASNADAFRKLKEAPLSTEFSTDKVHESRDSDDEASAKSDVKRVSFEDVLNELLEKTSAPNASSSGTPLDTAPSTNVAGFDKNTTSHFWGPSA